MCLTQVLSNTGKALYWRLHCSPSIWFFTRCAHIQIRKHWHGGEHFLNSGQGHFTLFRILCDDLSHLYGFLSAYPCCVSGKEILQVIEMQDALDPQAANASHRRLKELEWEMVLVSLTIYWSHKMVDITGSHLSLHVKQNTAFSKPCGRKLNDCEISICRQRGKIEPMWDFWQHYGNSSLVTAMPWVGVGALCHSNASLRESQNFFLNPQCSHLWNVSIRLNSGSLRMVQKPWVFTLPFWDGCK